MRRAVNITRRFKSFLHESDVVERQVARSNPTTEGPEVTNSSPYFEKVSADLCGESERRLNISTEGMLGTVIYMTPGDPMDGKPSEVS